MTRLRHLLRYHDKNIFIYFNINVRKKTLKSYFYSPISKLDIYKKKNKKKNKKKEYKKK